MNILIIIGAKYLIFFLLLVALGHFLSLSRQKKKRMVIFSLVALPLIYLAAKVAGHFYFDPRPFVVGHFQPLLPHEPDNGFPSDHALLASAVSMIIFFSDKKLGLSLWVLAALVGLSRVLAGVHHPVDILGSMVISVLLASLAYLFWPKPKLDK